MYRCVRVIHYTSKVSGASTWYKAYPEAVWKQQNCARPFFWGTFPATQVIALFMFDLDPTIIQAAGVFATFPFAIAYLTNKELGAAIPVKLPPELADEVLPDVVWIASATAEKD